MKSVLVIGMSRFGSLLAKELIKQGNEVMIADIDEKVINALASDFSDAQIADCRNESVLKSFGIENFEICFVTIGDNFQASLEITSLLKELGAKTVVSFAKSESQKKFLKKIGADDVVYLEQTVAEKLAVRYSNDNIFDVIELTDDYSIYELPIHPSWKGKSIKDIDVRAKYRLNILAIKQGEDLNPAPGPMYIFKDTDHVVVLGKDEDVEFLTLDYKKHKSK